MSDDLIRGIRLKSDKYEHESARVLSIIDLTFALAVPLGNNSKHIKLQQMFQI
jgi:hypothetical protein